MTDPTTQGAWLVKGEQDCGPQRRCFECRDWWPLTSEHWIRNVQINRHPQGGRPKKSAIPAPHRSVYFLKPCRACRVSERRVA